MVKQGRNERCACGSGKKYKNCCFRNEIKSDPSMDLGPLILQAGLRGLAAARSERDEAERTLHQLIDDPRSTKDDKLNASFSLVGIAQRRGDHRCALEQLESIVVGASADMELQILNLKATSLTQLGAHDDAAALCDILLANPAAARGPVSGWWALEAGRTYFLAGRVEDAIRMTKRAVLFFEEAKNELEHLTRAKSNLAIFMLKSDKAAEVAQAEKSLEDACDVKIAIGDAEGASTNFSQLSLHHFAQGRFEKAIAYGRKDLKLSKFVGDERSIASTLGNMAMIYLRVLQLSEARTFAREPIACAMLAVSALEAFINSTVYFANEAAKSRAMTLPPELLADAFAYQRHTELTKKWDALGTALCVHWPPPAPIWANFIKLVQLRNELVHYKAEGFARVAPTERHPPEHLRNLPLEIALRDIPSSWPVRLLTPSFAHWSVSAANDLIHHFRSSYRFALPVKLDAASDT